MSRQILPLWLLGCLVPARRCVSRHPYRSLAFSLQFPLHETLTDFINCVRGAYPLLWHASIRTPITVFLLTSALVERKLRFSMIFAWTTLGQLTAELSLGCFWIPVGSLGPFGPSCGPLYRSSRGLPCPAGHPGGTLHPTSAPSVCQAVRRGRHERSATGSPWKTVWKLLASRPSVSFLSPVLVSESPCAVSSVVGAPCICGCRTW